jgi:hypothetical protein
LTCGEERIGTATAYRKYSNFSIVAALLLRDGEP